MRHDKEPAPGKVRKFCPYCGIVDLDEGSTICPNCQFDFDTLTEEERALADNPELGEKADRDEFLLHALSLLIGAVALIALLWGGRWLLGLIF